VIDGFAERDEVSFLSAPARETSRQYVTVRPLEECANRIDFMVI
jgi:hypothetical protein